MRTTLTLDADVARLVEAAMRADRRSMKEVVNDALREALAAHAERRPYSVAPHHTSVRAGVDPSGFNRLADELDDESLVDRVRRAHP